MKKCRIKGTIKLNRGNSSKTNNKSNNLHKIDQQNEPMRQSGLKN